MYIYFFQIKEKRKHPRIMLWFVINYWILKMEE